MSAFHPYFTSDGSVGLYNEDFDDIYHSATGALTEAYEKFIYPVNFDKLLQKKTIKVLDICYGIGYNSKSFLNFIFENYFSKKNKKYFTHAKTHIDAIDTDKNVNQNIQINNDAIYGDNIFSKIYIKAVDNDKFLSYLSPFIKTGEKNIKNNNFDFEYKNIQKYFEQRENISKPKINKLINFLIFEKITQNYPDIIANEDLYAILNNKKYNAFFDDELKRLYNFYIKSQYKYAHETEKLLCLHNIYYQYISNRYKRGVKHYKLDDIRFELKIDDARKIIKDDNNLYNLIFLDAFTPSKCPCLWSYEFFCELFKHLEDDGMILTYASSAAVRSAMIEAGFSVGNIYNERENKFTGTIAVKNNSLIKYPLSEFDLGLLKTTAGIFYRDENLTGQNEAIIARRKIEVKNSNRLSSSHYIKNKGAANEANV